MQRFHVRSAPCALLIAGLLAFATGRVSSAQTPPIDPSGEVLITSRFAGDAGLSLDGSIVVWRDTSVRPSRQSDIHGYDLAAGREFVVAEGDVSADVQQGYCVVGGRWVAWQQREGEGLSLWISNIDTGARLEIHDGTTTAWLYPQALEGEWFLWVEQGPGGDFDLYIMRLDLSNPAAPAVRWECPLDATPDSEESWGFLREGTIFHGKDPGRGVWEWESERNWDVWRCELADVDMNCVSTGCAPFFADPELHELALGFDGRYVVRALAGAYGLKSRNLYLHEVATGQDTFVAMAFPAQLTSTGMISRGWMVYPDAERASRAYAYRASTGDHYPVSTSVGVQYTLVSYPHVVYATANEIRANTFRPATFRLEPAAGAGAGGGMDLELVVENEIPIQGGRLGLLYDDTRIALDRDSVERGPDFPDADGFILASAQSGGACGPDAPAGAMSVIWVNGRSQGVLLAPGTHRVLTIHCERGPAAGAGEVVPIRIADCIGDPPVPPRVVGEDDAEFGVLTRDGEVTVPGAFTRGDVDNNRTLNLTDPVRIFTCLFLRGEECPACADAADADDSGVLNITDGIYLLRSLFLSGAPQPPAPFGECGSDPTEDDLAPCEEDLCGAG